MISLSQKLNDTLKSIELTEDDYKRATVRHTEVNEAIKQDIGCNTIIVGSYTKKTAITPLNDVDILVWLPKDFGGFNSISNIANIKPETILKKMKTTIKNLNINYDTIRTQPHCLHLQYPHDTFNIDLIPAFAEIDHTASNDFDRLFSVPDKESGSWLYNNPIADRERMKEASGTGNQMVIPILKLLKQWKTQLSISGHKTFKSYHLECILVYLAKHTNTIFYAESDFFTTFKNCIPEIIKVLNDNTINIQTDLHLENDPVDYFRSQDGRRERALREIKNLKDTLDEIDQLYNKENFSSALTKLEALFINNNTNATKIERYTKVPPNKDDRSFG